MPDLFKKRSSEIEIMDDLNFEGEVIDVTLKELHVINKWLGGNNVIIKGLEQLFKGVDAKKIPPVLKIADLGCGGGDLLMLIAKWARKKKIKIELVGIDANPYIIEYAKKNTQHFPEISYSSINIFSEEFKKLKFDVFTCTLFCHHFEDQLLIQLLKQLKENCTLGVVINDIHRHWFAYYSIGWLTALFSKSFMVRNDAKVSVLRAFLKEELLQILNEAGFRKYSVKWRWAFRYQTVGWK